LQNKKILLLSERLGLEGNWNQGMVFLPVAGRYKSCPFVGPVSFAKTLKATLPSQESILADAPLFYIAPLFFIVHILAILWVFCFLIARRAYA
jgi:hypothetical protein